MPHNRAEGRNVHIYDANDPTTVLGGLVLVRGVTNANFFSMDNYKVICFAEDGPGIAGRHLGQEFLNNPSRPIDQLLRWHFRQAVLVNMRGAGEPIFETDFPPGTDMMGEVLSGPRAAERMEFELFSRLAIE
ncbi:MAG: hypothetical protein M1840_000667 [Geoglossum simile]|nr:MAG: hypothetical protein M1840_000667 [Geoglossum simile]